MKNNSMNNERNSQPLSEASMKKPVEMTGLSSQWCEASPSSQITTTVHKKKHYRWSLPYLWIHFYVSVLTSKAYSLFKKKTKKCVHKKTRSQPKIKVMVTIICYTKIINFQMKKSCERISYENTSIKLRYAAITVNIRINRISFIRMNYI